MECPPGMKEADSGERPGLPGKKVLLVFCTHCQGRSGEKETDLGKRPRRVLEITKFEECSIKKQREEERLS